jgi:hypothetical protein
LRMFYSKLASTANKEAHRLRVIRSCDAKDIDLHNFTRSIATSPKSKTEKHERRD